MRISTVSGCLSISTRAGDDLESPEGLQGAKGLFGGKMNALDFARGRKEICKLMKVEDWGTIRDWTRRYSFPLRRFPGNKQIPFVIPHEARLWLIKFSELKAKKKQSTPTISHPCATSRQANKDI